MPMQRRDVIAVLALVAAAIVTFAVVLFGLPALYLSPPSAIVPSSLPLLAGTSFPLTPEKQNNGTTLYSRLFATNLTGSCQLIQGSWAATAVTMMAEGTGSNGSFNLFVFPLSTLYNGSVMFESWTPDTVQVLETIQATRTNPCNAPVSLGSWGIYNSGNMCPSVPPNPPWQLRYDFVLRNTGAVNMVANIDFYFAYRNASGAQNLLEGTGTYTVPANSNASFTNTIYYFDCPGEVGGTPNFAITYERPSTL